MNGYELSRAWFDFAFENPEKISPTHGMIYFFAIEHNNRLGWREKFGFPTQMACDAIGINKPQTFIKYFNDLVEWGFIKVVERSKNQYSANIISLIYAKPKNGKALDKAIVKHAAKQVESTRQSISPIDKPLTFEPLTIEQPQAARVQKHFIPPTLQDVILFFNENGYNEEHAIKVYRYYDDANWHDSNGKKVKSWKQKMRGVWFKDDGKKPKLPTKAEYFSTLKF